MKTDRCDKTLILVVAVIIVGIVLFTISTTVGSIAKRPDPTVVKYTLNFDYSGGLVVKSVDVYAWVRNDGGSGNVVVEATAKAQEVVGSRSRVVQIKGGETKIVNLYLHMKKPPAWTPHVVVTAKPAPTTPGCEAVFAIAGLLAVAYLLRRRK